MVATEGASVICATVGDTDGEAEGAGDGAIVDGSEGESLGISV